MIKKDLEGVVAGTSSEPLSMILLFLEDRATAKEIKERFAGPISDSGYKFPLDRIRIGIDLLVRLGLVNERRVSGAGPAYGVSYFLSHDGESALPLAAFNLGWAAEHGRSLQTILGVAQSNKYSTPLVRANLLQALTLAPQSGASLARATGIDGPMASRNIHDLERLGLASCVDDGERYKFVYSRTGIPMPKKIPPFMKDIALYLDMHDGVSDREVVLHFSRTDDPGRRCYTPRTIMEGVNRLVKLKYVRRDHDPDDHLQARLTPEGEGFKRDWLGGAVRCLSENPEVFAVTPGTMRDAFAAYRNRTLRSALLHP